MRYTLAALLLCLMASNLKAGEIIRDPGFFLVERGFHGAVDPGAFAKNRWHWARQDGERLILRVDAFGDGRSFCLEGSSGATPAKVKIVGGELYVHSNGSIFRYGNFGHFENTYILVCGCWVPNGCIFVHDGNWELIKKKPRKPQGKIEPLEDSIQPIPESSDWQKVPQRNKEPHPASKFSNKARL